jgi:hypothetical protein
MNRLVLVSILLVSCSAFSQDFPRFELAGGYSYGTYENISTTYQFSPQGWNGSFATNVKRWFAIEVDAGGQYLNRSVTLSGNPYTLSNAAFYSFHAGPRFAARGERLTPFAHTLFGLHRTPSYSQATFPTPGTVVVPYENAMGAAFGGGFDLALTPRFALRTQGDYFFTRLSNGPLTALNGYDNRFRVVGGIVMHFGDTDRRSARRRKPKQTDVPTYAAVPKPPATAAAPVPAPVSVPSPAPASSTGAAAPFYAPAPAAAPKPAPVATAPQPVQGQVVSQPPRSPYQEESLGELARRQRELKKKKQQQQQQQGQPR